MPAVTRKDQERKLDQAIEATFPASDPIAVGGTTGTEPPHRPIDRKAPELSKDEIVEAQRARTIAAPKRAKRSARGPH